MIIPHRSFRFWIILVIIAGLALATIPLAVFIYNYGERMTTGSLYNQLEVALSDIAIRFTDTVEEYSSTLDDFVRQVAENGSPYAVSPGRYAVLTLTDTEGRILFSTRQIPDWVDFTVRLPQVPFEGTRYDTDFRYSTYYSDEVVMNIERCVTSEDGGLLGYAFLDIIGTPFIRYAEPALVNEVCLLNDSSGMVSSLVHLSDYRALDDGWVFSDSLESRDGRYLVASTGLEDYGMTLVCYLNTSPYTHSLHSFYVASAVIMLCSLILALLVGIMLTIPLVSPIRSLVSAMEQAERGNLDIRVEKSAIREMESLNAEFNEMLTQIQLLMRKNEEEKDKVRDAERKALEAQMNPHFLFNTLNVIRALARIHRQSDIEEITIRLGRLLRYAVDNRESTETLENSFLMVESYLGIQKVRFADRLDAECHMDPELAGVITPKLIIQPLVENAICHGLQPKLGPWKLSINARRSGGRVVISVCDNGVGFDAGPYQDMENFADSGHTGMYNVYKRLEIYYGNKAEFKVQSEPGKGSQVVLSLPLDKGEKR